MFIAWGATARKINKGSCVFFEGDIPVSFYYLATGQIRMFNTNDEGRDFTQGIFEAGDTFGEPPLLIREPYPASAMAMKDSVILRLAKDRFFRMLDECPDFERLLLLRLSRRLYCKSILSRDIINNNPEHRLLAFLKNYCKNTTTTTTSERMPIPYTRQQLADMLGLRVETVIRTLKAMQQKKQVEIINRKLYI